MQGLVCRSPQLDLPSREEMYFLEDPIRRSAARAAPPRYPHVQLDEDFFSLIPASEEEVAREIPAARRRGGGDGGGFPADRASPSRVREREEGGEGWCG